MKKCTTCGKEFDDTKMFCPTCGGQLVPATPPGPPVPPSAGSASWFSQWGGILLAVLGILIEWNFSALLGLIVAAVGAVSGHSSSNKLNKVGSIVAAVIAALLYVVYILS